jgi:hypothetical protein
MLAGFASLVAVSERHQRLNQTGGVEIIKHSRRPLWLAKRGSDIRDSEHR